nr:atpase family aaa domain-containing protein 5 [Quercus suber]
MALTVFSPAMSSNEQPYQSYQHLHPFFRQDVAASQNSKTTEVNNERCREVQHDQKEAKVSHRAAGETGGKKQKTLNELVNRQVAQSESIEDKKHANTAILPLPHPQSTDQAPRKRRKTNEHESVTVDDQIVPSSGMKRQRQSSPRVVIPVLSSSLATMISETRDTDFVERVDATPPKKMLRLSSGGKFSSPPTKSKIVNEKSGSEATSKVQRMGRRSKVMKPSKLIVRLAYGLNNDRKQQFGERVAAIMEGKDRVMVGQTKKRQRRLKEMKQTLHVSREHDVGTESDTDRSRVDRGDEACNPAAQRTLPKPRSTHPFFLGKPVAEVSSPEKPAKAASRRISSSVTPGKLKMHATRDRTHEQNEPSYIVGSALLKDRLMVKHPGALESPWPGRGQAHVRGLSSPDQTVRKSFRSANGRGKKKSAAVSIVPPEDSILQLYRPPILKPEEDGVLRDDGYHDPHPSLTLPRRALLTGSEIKDKVILELSNNTPGLCPGTSPASQQKLEHPAIQTLLERLPSTTSSFDDNKGGTQSWTQKYAPSSPDQVLQAAPEMSVMKEWLLGLTVSVVESTSRAESKIAPNKPSPKGKKKRRRRHSDLDDFLVDDDESIHDMDELPDSQGPDHPFKVNEPKSVVHLIEDGVKLTNVLLLSGPHGCGKSAAAYAVANHLGFRVFEISSFERRSGKDVLDKVGDMTENHLVKSHRMPETRSTVGEEQNDINDEFERDLASGRQGKMSAFFRPQTKPEKTFQPKHTERARAMQTIRKALKPTSKDQQQSLVLLEEVDVLFKDDKEFWTTVLKLIVTSKRPFILTCNDEDMVPVQALALHAILRFTTPPVDLAVDYMLLIAATEGHLLRRRDVSSLYDSKRHDLRASISELDFWCQMGVGDPKAGLSWIYQRWPPGSDIDVNGNKIRVVSDGTFRHQRSLQSELGSNEHDMLLWSSQGSGLEPHELLGWHGLTGVEWLDETTGPAPVKQRYRALTEFAQFADTFSSMDLYARTGSGAGDIVLDVTQPELSQKARNNYTEGMVLLQTDEVIDPYSFDEQLAVATTLTAYKLADLPTTGITHPLGSHQPLCRKAFAVFDPIAVPDNTMRSFGMQQSTFDAPFVPIVVDVAPYVRSIVHHDLERERLYSTIGSGGQVKNLRTTRAARSAMDEFGIGRQDVRREKWFCKALNLAGVMATGGKNWAQYSNRPPSDLAGKESVIMA